MLLLRPIQLRVFSSNLNIEKQFIHTTGVFSYVIASSKRARRITVSVHRDGRVRVALPVKSNERHVEPLLLTHAVWILKKLQQFKDMPMPRAPLKGKARDYKERKELARAFVKSRLLHLNEHYNFPYKRIAIKNMSTRWGSCSANGNLNFHYRILDLPREQQDYLIVHELCHIKEMNHKQPFWNLVLETQPAYKNLRKKLKNFVR